MCIPSFQLIMCLRLLLFVPIRNDEMLEQTIQGLKLYFNHSLGTMLLYRSERNQYQELLSYGKEWVDLYGAEHLLRLFGKS